VDKLRIAVLGGGAVAERVHLPALARSRDASAAVLVEHSAERAARLAREFAIPRVAPDYRDVIGQVDAAIVALPHHLHAPAAAALLDAGIHVLVEKPMALAPRECDEMIAAAARSRAVLAVGLLRRCSPSLRWVKSALDHGLIGRVRAFDFREGSVYRWPVASASMFRPEGGGGVLADAGAHVLDLVLWWFGAWRSFAYRDDARGGVEADCLLDVEMANGVRGRIELSRTRDLANACTIDGELGTIVVGTKTDSIVTVTWRDGTALSARGTADGCPSPTSLVDLALPQLANFVAAIRGDATPLVSGTEAKRSIELLAACYAARQPWIHPWDLAPAAVAPPAETHQPAAAVMEAAS